MATLRITTTEGSKNVSLTLETDQETVKEAVAYFIQGTLDNEAKRIELEEKRINNEAKRIELETEAKRIEPETEEFTRRIIEQVEQRERVAKRSPTSEEYEAIKD